MAVEILDGDLFALTAGLGTRVNGRESSAKPRECRVKGRARILRRSLVGADVVGLAVAFLVVQAFVSNFDQGDFLISLLLFPGLVGWVLLAQTYGLYEHDEVGVARSAADDLPGVVMLSTLATWLGLLIVNAADLAHPRIHITASFWAGSILAIVCGRAVARAVVQRHSEPEQTVIVGTGRVGRRIAQKLGLRPEYGLKVVGFVDDDPLELPDEAPPFLGDTSRLEQIVRGRGIERVIVAFSKLSGDAQVDLLRRCAELRVRVDIVPRMYEVIGSRTHFHDIAGIPLVSVHPPALSRSARLLKRGLDVAVAGLAVLLLSPFMLFAAWRIKAGSNGPILFRQERMGAGGRRFQILKFRSMYSDADARKSEVGHLNKHSEDGPRMFKVTEDPRVTPFGRFLRKWSLDELPQLLNVLRGEMSLVGPRPLILDEDEHIVGHHRRRLNITPGVTGLWQVLGRSDIPFSEMVTLDYLYVTNWSLWGDIKLLARTVPVVLSRRGAY